MMEPARTNPLRGVRPSLPSLRRPHGDHRDLRARASSSPSALRGGDHHPDQYLMTLASLPLSLSALPLASTGDAAARPFLVLRRDLPRNRPAISTKSVLFLSSGAPARPNPPAPVSRTTAAPSVPAKIP